MVRHAKSMNRIPQRELQKKSLKKSDVWETPEQDG